MTEFDFVVLFAVVNAGVTAFAPIPHREKLALVVTNILLAILALILGGHIT